MCARYTRSTLKRSIRLAGFELVWCSYFNVLLFPVIATAVLGKRIFFPRDMYRSNVVPLPEWQNEILYRCSHSRALRVAAVSGRRELLVVANPTTLAAARMRILPPMSGSKWHAVEKTGGPAKHSLPNSFNKCYKSAEAARFLMNFFGMSGADAELCAAETGRLLKRHRIRRGHAQAEDYS